MLKEEELIVMSAATTMVAANLLGTSSPMKKGRDHPYGACLLITVMENSATSKMNARYFHRPVSSRFSTTSSNRTRRFFDGVRKISRGTEDKVGQNDGAPQVDRD
jgi:hypothetical protein